MHLGTPNNQRKSLERWLALADSGNEADKASALRCLARYVHPSIAPKNGDWAAWYKTHKHRICFIDSTGFWWQLDPTVLEREVASAR